MATLQEEIGMLDTLLKQAEEKEVRDRDAFIQARTKHEAVLATFKEGVDSVDPELLKDIKIPKDLSPQKIFASLYSRPFNREAYEKELADFKSIQRQIGQVLLKQVKDIRICMEDYVNGG